MHPTNEDEKAIRTLVETWQAASLAGDLDAVLSLMTDDVVFLRPGHAPMIGKAAFADASSASSQQSFSVSSTSNIQEITVAGDIAYMWQKLTVVVTPTDGSGATRREGFTLTIFRNEGGKWLLARDANMLAVVPTGGE